MNLVRKTVFFSNKFICLIAVVFFLYIYIKRILWSRERNLEHWLGYVISLKLFLEVVIKRVYILKKSANFNQVQKSINSSKQKMQNICNFGEFHISPSFPLSFPFFINQGTVKRAAKNVQLVL